MSLSVENVISRALALPNSDRVEVVEAILASLRPEDRPPFDESWRDVILRRSAELDSGEVSGVPWSEVKAKARRRASG
jgi:putative addiction module component (TIGR02574 family)